MMTRTTSKAMTFTRPFTLSGVDTQQPAGTYVVETDEEQIEGVSFLAYRRVGVRIQLPANPKQPGIVETISVDPAAFETALTEGGYHE